jgi:phosphoenolpyruvate-protein phosphotransferase (PTS system enzyme I)
VLTKEGIAVKTGIAVGKALIVQESTEPHAHPQYIEPQHTVREESRLHEALARTVEELDAEICEMRRHSDIGAKILEFHRALVVSPELEREITAAIREKAMTAAYAISCVMRRWYDHFSTTSAIRRHHDILDVEQRVLRHVGVERGNGLRDLDQDVVVVAHALTPGQTAALGRRKVKGFATDVGGKTSHTAIMARALAIPAVVGTGDLSRHLEGGETVIIDGIRGVVIVDPDDETLARYREEEGRHRQAFRQLVAERDLPAETLDGYEVEILANIELSEEVEMALAMGAAGIGLYRTEFLYEETHDPNEDLQLDVYEEVVRRLRGRPCVIRTMDLGADKYAPAGQSSPERNPFLGSRSIRYSLQNPELFAIQLRAILRASAAGDVRLLFPMISTLEELREARAHVEKAKESLRAGGIPFRDPIPLGIMVEVPSAALTADQLAQEVDFFSIGTNDLVQYALAVDRVNERVAHLYQPGSPSILRLLRTAIEAAQKHGIPISACGEMSADPRFTVLLLGLGLRHFSVAPVAIPIVKHVVRSVTLAETEAIAEKALTLPTAQECNAFLQERVGSLLPGLA